MVPYFEFGKVLLTKDMKKLEKQLREYPYGRKRDLIDDLAYGLKNVGHSKIRKKVEVYDPNSFEAIIKSLDEKANKGESPWAKAREYSAHASPSLW